MKTKKMKRFALLARTRMEGLACTKEQMKTAFANGLMNGYAKYMGAEGVAYDDALVPDDIHNTLSSDILSGEFVRVEDIGMIYQYFVDADRAEAVDVIGGGDIEGSLVTEATQVFTPSWIVKYLIDNSLGKYLAAEFGRDICLRELGYYIANDGAEAQSRPTEDITFLDPCCGSGNMLVYAFDVFMKMYTLRGTAPTDAARLILSRNIFGADIDPTAAALSSFALKIKAFEYDKSVFDLDLKPCIQLVSDENNIGSLDFSTDKSSLTGRKFTVVCTNPPYLGRIGGELKKYLNKTAKPYSKDLFTAFMYRGLLYCEDGGYMAYLTPNVWMYLSSHKAVRELILDEKKLCSLIQLEKGSFFSEASVDLCAFVVENRFGRHSTLYIRPEGTSCMKGQQKSVENAIKCINNGTECDYVFSVCADRFNAYPDRIMAFYAPDAVAELFDRTRVGDIYTVKQGMSTGDNKRFVKYWYEVPYDSIGFDCLDTESAKASGKRWFPYNKGGKYRKWYGNNDYVVMYENDGQEMKEYTSTLSQGTWVRLKSRDYYFREAVTWSFISSSHFGVRYSPSGSIFDVAGSSLFGENLKYVLGFLSTKTAFYLLQLINPTMNYQIRDVKLLPFISDDSVRAEVEALVDRCIALSRREWDSYELSYGFVCDPLVVASGRRLSFSDAVSRHICASKQAFEELKQCEIRLNEIFARLYRVENVIDTKIKDSDITFRIPDERLCAENLMSYIAGCALGRYSCGHRGVVSTERRHLSYDELVFFAEKFIREHFGGIDDIEQILGTDIHTYYRKHFHKKHCLHYRKRPIYTKCDDGFTYFDFNT